MTTTLVLNDPLYTGTSGSDDTPGLLPVAIHGRPYQIEVAEMRRRTMPALRESTDVTAEPGEAALAQGGLWTRYSLDWSHGGGQEVWDAADSDRARFRTSLNVDVWTKHQLSLLPATTLTLPSSASNLRVVVAGDRLYCADGTVLRWTTDLEAWNEVEDMPGSTIAGLATNGFHVYAATPDGIYRTDRMSTSAAIFGTQNPFDGVWWANGRLLASDEESLSEVDASGNASELVAKEMVGADWRWRHVVAGPTRVYVAGDAGGVGELSTIGLDPDTGALQEFAISAAPLPPGEIVHSLVFQAGVAVLGTSAGLRVAEVGESGALTYLTPAEVGPVKCLALDGRWVRFGWSNFDMLHTGTGRADLRHLNTDGTCAHASDVMADAQGDVVSLAVFNGRTVFAVDGVGVYASTDELAESGWLESGRIRFGTVEDKRPVFVDVRHEPLAGSVDVAVSDPVGSEAAGSSTAPRSTRPVYPLVATQRAAEWHEVRVTLNRGTPTSGPVLRWWLMRATPVPQRVEEIILPIIMADQVQVGHDNGYTHRFRVYDEYAFLSSLAQSGRIVRLQDGATSWRVKVERVELAPVSRNDDRDWYEGRINVLLTCYGVMP